VSAVFYTRVVQAEWRFATSGVSLTARRERRAPEHGPPPARDVASGDQIVQPNRLLCRTSLRWRIGLTRPCFRGRHAEMTNRISAIRK
jgi:hypothetical protein